MTAYYNEFNKHAAKWLRNLIAAGHIAPGDVDERSIEDVRPADLVGYRQCHFFAGVGVWSYALRRAGWSDDRDIWTASCPCQPFSASGEGAGFADERHLWPALFHLVRERRPPTLIGEQVAGKDAEPWIDLVCADLGSLGYASGAIAFPSAGVGAPHIRDRLYWVAHASGIGRRQEREDAGRLASRNRAQGVAAGSVHGGGSGGVGDTDSARGGRNAGAVPGAQGGASLRAVGDGAESSGATRRLADPGSGKCERRSDHEPLLGDGAQTGRNEIASHLERHCGPCGLADANGGNAGAEGLQRSGQHGLVASNSLPAGVGWIIDADSRAGPTNGFWRATDWLFCTDGLWRPVEPGTFPLAHGSANRLGRVRAYGNAINAEAARVFIECVMESM